MLEPPNQHWAGTAASNSGGWFSSNGGPDLRCPGFVRYMATCDSQIRPAPPNRGRSTVDRPRYRREEKMLAERGGRPMGGAE